MCYADLQGLNNVVGTIERFQRELGERWQPAPLLKRLAAEGRTFREYDEQRKS
jgi:3-hydroxyacyl-CoA dehydrogenase